MIHYAQLLLLDHLAEAAPRPIPMTPSWWVVTLSLFVEAAARTNNRDWIARTHEIVSWSRNTSGISVVLPVLCRGNFLVEYST